jgi:hypothetical protein
MVNNMDPRIQLQAKTMELEKRSSRVPEIRKKIGRAKLKDVVESDKVTVMGRGKDAVVRVRTKTSVDVRSAALLSGVDSGILSLKYVEMPNRQDDGTLKMEKFFEVQVVPSPNSYAYSEKETLAKLFSVAHYLAEILPLELDIRELKRQLGPAKEPELSSEGNHSVIKGDPLRYVRGLLNPYGARRPKTLRDLFKVA